MHIFLTGATGFVGSAILPELLDGGHRVTCLIRSEAAADAVMEAGGEAHHGDLRDIDSLRRGATAADAVIHAAFDHNFAQMAASAEDDRAAIRAIGDALAGTGKRFVVSSGLPPMSGRAATEDDVLPADGHGMPRQSEQAAIALVERGIDAMIVRMSQCHDETKQGFGSYLMAHALKSGTSAYVGDGLNRWPTVHRLDAARLYRRVLEQGQAGHRYHAVGEEGVTVLDVARAIGSRLDLPVVSLSPEESGAHFGWLDRIAKMDTPASSLLTQQRLAWQPQERAGIVADIEKAVLL